MGRGKHSFLNDGDEHVGVDLLAKPLSSVGARPQHASAYLDFPVPKNEITCIRKAILICRFERRRQRIGFGASLEGR